MKQYRLLELYSGIGGMRYALQIAGIPFKVVAAVDINPIVNEIYCYNFGKDHVLQRNIQTFTVTELEDMNLDIITMSPPCQPFTRVGLKKDINDARSSSFLYILEIIEKLYKKPSFIVLENVKGFEESEARKELVQFLLRCNYCYQEFLLSPSSFGIPNSRLRYYVIARLKECGQFSFPFSTKILDVMPNSAISSRVPCGKHHEEDKLMLNMCPLSHFLEGTESTYDSYLVPDSVLLKYWPVFDIVNQSDNKSCCFTKAYTHYALGSGSVLVSYDHSRTASIFEDIINTDDEKKQLILLKSLRIRYFTPREIANIMCFPSTFYFPEHITEKQKYRSLGNSINVFVVSCLIKLLFQDK